MLGALGICLTDSSPGVLGRRPRCRRAGAPLPLSFSTGDRRGIEIPTMLTTTPASLPKLSDATWIDLLDPSDDERHRVEQATKLRLPTREAIEEIESSSRVFKEGDALYLSTPVLQTTDCMKGEVTAVGFVLSPTYLVTLRFARIAAFETVTAASASAAAPNARDVFLKILEAIVEKTADALEHGSAELEAISHAAFRAEPSGRRSRVVKTGAALRGALRQIGRMGDGISHIRDTLLGLGRIVAYIHEGGHHSPGSADAAGAADAARATSLRGDIASLNEYQVHLSNKVQFLLDATLGFINIEQNDIVKTLTIASVAGIPPVLIGGIYGMNFKNMPELNWSLGYPFALVLIALSALAPVAWFKWRGWM
jgi:magnesium transporter